MVKNIADMVEGNWDKLEGKIKKQWGKLSDDDITQIEGSYDKLVGKIKEAYGETEDKVTKKIQSFLDDTDLENATHNGSDKLWDAVKEIKDKLEKSLVGSMRNIKNTSIGIEEDIVTYIKNNPVKSVIFTTLAGALFAKFYFNNKEK